MRTPDAGRDITTAAWEGVDASPSPASVVSSGRGGRDARFVRANKAYSGGVPSSTPGESWWARGTRKAGEIADKTRDKIRRADSAVNEVIPSRQRVREMVTTIRRGIIHIDPSEAEVTSVCEKMDRLKIFGQSSTDYLIGMGAGFATRIATMTAFQTVLGVSGGWAVSGTAGALAGGLRAVYREASTQAKTRIEAEADEAEKARLRARLNGKSKVFTRIYDADNGKMVRAGSKGAVAGAVGATLGAWAGQWLMEKISESGIAQEAMEYVSSKYKDLKEWADSTMFEHFSPGLNPNSPHVPTSDFERPITPATVPQEVVTPVAEPSVAATPASKPAVPPAAPAPSPAASPEAAPAAPPAQPAPAVVPPPVEVAPPPPAPVAPPAPAAPPPAEGLPPPAAANLPAREDIVINKGDTIWGKTREFMEATLKRPVLDSEVYTGVTQVLADNGLSIDDARNIQPGTHLTNIEGIKSVVSKMLPEAPATSGLASAPAEYIANTGDTAGKLLDLKWDPVVDSQELGEFVKLNDSELRSAWQDMWNSLSDGDEIKNYMKEFMGDGSFPIKNDAELQNLIKLAKDGDKDAYRRLLWAARFLKKGVSYKLPKVLAMAGVK